MKTTRAVLILLAGMGALLGCTPAIAQNPAVKPASTASSAAPSNIPQDYIVSVTPPGEQTLHDLKSIVISFDFNHATLQQALYYVQVESKAKDPAHAGVQFVLSRSLLSLVYNPITLKRDSVTVEQAVRAVCDACGANYSVDGRVVRIRCGWEPLGDAAETPLTAAPGDIGGQATVRKLQSIIIDQVNFDKLDIARALQFLTLKSRQLDPEHKGITFALGDVTPGDNTQRVLWLRLKDTPLDDVIRYIEQQTNLHAHIAADVVTFKS